MNNTTFLAESFSSDISSIPFSYSIAFEFERKFDYDGYVEYYRQRMWYPFFCSAVYLAAIVGLKRAMRRRPAGFDLRGLLVAWNIFLSVFSLLAIVRVGSELVYVLREFGFYHSVCRDPIDQAKSVYGFWVWLYGLSKVAEFGDTAFLLLRKRRLIFLHWYHHITVLLYVYYNAAHKGTAGRWFCSVNLVVHAFMYSYFALAALRYRIPRFVSILLTLAQLSQMVVGIYIGAWIYRYRMSGMPCNVELENLLLSSLMYLSYLVLFANFFYHAYISKKPTSSPAEDKLPGKIARNGKSPAALLSGKKKIK